MSTLLYENINEYTVKSPKNKFIKYLKELFKQLDEDIITEEIEELYTYLQSENKDLVPLEYSVPTHRVKPREDYEVGSWIFSGVSSSGKAKFKRFTNDTLNDVIEFLDNKKIKYIVKEKALMLSIYSCSRKYSYYYTTGRWALDKHAYEKHRKKIFYRSKGIEDFYTRFFEPTFSKEINRYDATYDNARYQYDRLKLDYPNLSLYIYLLFWFSSKATPFLEQTKIDFIKNHMQYRIYNKYRGEL
jgi:hypothetical protein